MVPQGRKLYVPEDGGRYQYYDGAAPERGRGGRGGGGYHYGVYRGGATGVEDESGYHQRYDGGGGRGRGRRNPRERGERNDRERGERDRDRGDRLERRERRPREDRIDVPKPAPMPTPVILGAKPQPAVPANLSAPSSPCPVVVKPLPEVTPQPTSGRKLLTPALDFVSDAAQMLLDQSTFTVVGVLGLQGAGKSTLLSELASHAEVFPPQSENTLMEGRHETQGVDVCVTNERLILLDTQPLLSPSILLDRPHSEGEQAVDMESVQLALFLLCVCHVVVVVQDWVADPELASFLRTVEMLQQGITHIFTSESARTDSEKAHFMPRIVFVFNKLPESMLMPKNIERTESVVESLFRSHAQHRASATEPEKHVCFSLPVKVADPAVNTESFQQCMRRVRAHIHSCDCRSLARSLTEREWHRSAARVWEQIRNSTIVADYFRFAGQARQYQYRG